MVVINAEEVLKVLGEHINLDEYRVRVFDDYLELEGGEDRITVYREGDWWVVEDEFINIYEEVSLPESLAQHDVYPEPEEVRDWLGEEKVKEIIAKYDKECKELDKDPNYIGDYDTCIQERLDEAFAEMLEERAERIQEKLDKAPILTLKLGDDVKVTYKPSYALVDCFVNIPHVHMYLSDLIIVKAPNLEKALEVLDDNVFINKIIEVYHELFPEYSNINT